MFFGDAVQSGKLAEASICDDNVDSPPFRVDGFVKPIKVSQLGHFFLTPMTLTPIAFTASSSSFW
jgi:hypothetical protein